MTYEDSKTHEVQVVFVSSDSDQESFDEYFGEMPWTAIPFASEELRESIQAAQGVAGIPALVIIETETGKVVTKDGRAKVVAAKSLDGVAWA